MNLTDRQTQVVETVRSFTEEYGYAPSVRELAGMLGISTAGAQHHLDALMVKGAIKRTPGIARSLRCT